MNNPIHTVLLWHMHQPYYVNPLNKMAIMPWVRLHAVRGYYDMIEVIRHTEGARANFNFTPVLMLQLEEIAEKSVSDLWESWSRKEPSDLTEFERICVLENFFKINHETLIYPLESYRQLLEKRGALTGREGLPKVAPSFSDQELRDLQTLFNLQWCGFSADKNYPELADLKRKGRGFTEEEKQRVLDIHHEIVCAIPGLYRQAAEEGRIELTTTPFFHPIMPLVYDTELAERCLPGRERPPRFSAPEDVRQHLQMAQESHQKHFGRKARGLWPSEGSVAPELIPFFAEAGFEYFCTDEDVLFRSLDAEPGRGGSDHIELFQPWTCSHNGTSVGALFRERPLSDYIGFNAARVPAGEATDYLTHNIEHLQSVVPYEDRGTVCLALDGENAWEAFNDGGAEFLPLFYQKLVANPKTRLSLLGEVFDQTPERATVSTLHTGSWINANFDIWIAEPEENRGWELLGETRAFLISATQRGIHNSLIIRKAWMEIFAAEGSDWFWWFGPDFQTDNDGLFDELFRLHLQSVYHLLDYPAPQVLSAPIKETSKQHIYTEPTAAICPGLHPEDASSNWFGAGHLHASRQHSAMYQSGRIAREVYFGTGNGSFFLRLDYNQQAPDLVRILFRQPKQEEVHLHRAPHGYTVCRMQGTDCLDLPSARAIHPGRIELEVPLRDIQAADQSERLVFTLEVQREGVPPETYPQNNHIGIPIY